MMPIPAISRQAGRFNAEDCSDLPITDFRDQALKAWAVYKARSRFAKVVINRYHIVEAKLMGIFGEPILTALALKIMNNLDEAGLPNVHHGAAAEVIRRDFATQGSLLPSGSWSVSATLSNRSAKTRSNSRCLSTGTGTGSSN
jgi:hypothetical protein